MDTLTTYALQFWQFSLVFILIIIGAIWKFLDRDIKPDMKFRLLVCHT